MKPKAEPCLRDYLTIHVPASTLMGDRLRKKKEGVQMCNPLMNKKLQIGKKNGIQIIYSTQPNKSFGKKRKMQSIPLLSNFRLNNQNKLRVVKDPRKTQYNFVFQKDKPKTEWNEKGGQVNESTRFLSSSQQNKCNSRSSLQSHMGQRQSTPSLLPSHNAYSRPIKTSQYFQTTDFITRRTDGFEKRMGVSGHKAQLCEHFSPTKKSSDQGIIECSYDRIMGQRIYITN